MTKTSFFTQLTTVGLKHVAMEIKLADNGTMTVFVTPKSDVAGNSDAFKVIMPFTLTAMPEDLDEGFFDLVKEPLIETGNIVSNIENYTVQLKEAEKLAKDKGKVDKKETTPAALTVSKEDKAKAEKLAKAEVAVKEQLDLCTNYTTFGKNKTKLKKAIDALKTVVDTTKLSSDLGQPALEFFEANNAIMDGSFVPLKVSAPEVVETDIEETEEVEETTEEIVAPIPPVEEIAEHVQEFEAEEVEEVVEEVQLEQPGNSLAAMQTDRTTNRRFELLALGLTETTTGFEGHGFVVANTLVENHTKEYWEELIKGILSVINIVHTPAVPVVTPEMEEIAIQNKIKNRTNRLLELGMVSDGGMNLVGFTFTVHIGQLRNDVDTEFEKLYENIRVASEKAKAVSAPAPMEIVKDNDVNVGERYEERKQKLFAMGMTINGLDFVKYKNSVTVLIVKSCNDLEFEELIANFSKSFEIFEQTVAERIQGLVNLGFEPQGNGTVFAKSDCNSILLEEIQKHTDDEWNSFTGLIAESLVNKAETVQTPIEEYEFVMNPGSPHSYKAYIGAGWNDQQLEQQSLGKLVKKEPQTAAPAPEAPQTPASLLGNDNELEIK